MPVAVAGKRLWKNIPLDFVSKKVTGGGTRATNAGLSLTSMIDFLVVTVVFLLMTFSASGETPVARGLNLPKAENTLDMVDAPVVAVVGSQILVDGTPAGNSRSVEESDRMQRIDELFNILKAKRELWKQTHPGKDFPRRGPPGDRPEHQGGRSEERLPDIGVRGLPQRQLHGQRAPQDRGLVVEVPVPTLEPTGRPAWPA